MTDEDLIASARHLGNALQARMRQPGWKGLMKRVLAVLPITGNVSMKLDWKAVRSLKDGWDQDGAPAPTAAAIDRAQVLVQLVKVISQHEPESIEPDAVGGVALWYYTSRSKIMASVRNANESIAICFYLRSAIEPDVTITTEISKARDLIISGLSR